MTEMPSPLPSGEDDGMKWSEIVASPAFQVALAPTDIGLHGIEGKLRELTGSETANDDERYLAGLLGAVASYWPNPDDFQNPYRPAIELADGRRTAVPDDLSADDLAVLTAVVDSLIDPIFRARVLDVLAMRGEGRQRAERHAAQVQALIDHGVDHDSLVYAQGEWSRALSVAGRFGAALQSQRDALAAALDEFALSTDDGSLVVMIARLLREHRVGSARATELAEKLVEISSDPSMFASVNTLEEAAKWHRIAGDLTAEQDTIFAVVQALVTEADAALATEGRGGIVAASLLEQALQELRRIPRDGRERLGARDLPTTLARRIREAGTLALGQMKTIQTESGDISHVVRGLLEFLAGQEPVEALRRFASFQPLASYDKEKADAERAVVHYPTEQLATVTHLDRDGRVVHRTGSSTDGMIYGETGPVWRRMTQSYQFRLGLLGGMLIPQAWMLLTTEHRISLADFETISRGSSVVPPKHEGLFARGLFHGYNGDFAAAIHLLAPRIEALIRYHLANAGEVTSAIDENGIENEIGLSALAKRERLVEVFGADLAFEIRALFAGPLGPNVRNDIAHGLVDDSSTTSGTSVYVWWLALKLAFIPYWNALHDTEVAEAREASLPDVEDGDDLGE